MVVQNPYSVSGRERVPMSPLPGTLPLTTTLSHPPGPAMVVPSPTTTTPSMDSAIDAPLFVAQAYHLGVVILLSIGLVFCLR